ncbi:FecR domain-containing protein [Dyadobacter sp. 32]|uniref:FecR domain-containing protein n=1 Tax=Dyadobacter sp. 32 TaxID=538966 RepID=UPI0039C62FDB
MAKEQDPILKAELISRYLKGDLSYEEHEQFRNWLEEDVTHKQLVDSLENEEVLANDLHFFSSVDKGAAWENLTRMINESPRQRPAPVGKYWKYLVAAMLIGMFSYVAFRYTYNDKRSKIAEVEIPIPKNDVLPGGDKATLTLADGSVLSLEDMTNGTVKEENGIKISKIDGQIVYEILGQKGSVEITYNTIHTPVGGQYHVVLPDGSKVWLNSESSLHFPTAFSGSERTVDLTGEGYFEIAKNSGMPFVVQAGETRVKVLGTHFNFMAYANEGASRTTLLEGSVKVSKGTSHRIIAPGEQAVIGDKIQVKYVDLDEAVAWKNGYFQFESENLKTILRQLKRWYGIEVENEQQIPDLHFTAVISRNTTLSQVLKMLEMSGELKFKIEGKKISIQERQ